MKTVSERADALFNLMKNGNWYSNAELALELDLSVQQITRTFVLLRERGHKFHRRKSKCGKFYKYRVDENGKFGLPIGTPESRNQKMVAVLNRIRMRAIEISDKQIQKEAENCLIAHGVLENNSGSVDE